MNKKRFSLLILISLLAFTLVACEAANGNDIPPVDTDDEIEVIDKEENTDLDNLEEDEADLSEDDKNDKIIVDLYFPTNEYIETGDIKNDRFGIEEKELLNNEALIASVYKELIKGPENSSDLTTVFDGDVELEDSYIKGNTAYLDFNSNNLNGGSLEEELFIDQIVGSLLSVDGIDQVQFLVDGNDSDSLMGHFIIDQPITGISEISE